MDPATLFDTFDLCGAVPDGRRSCPAERQEAGASDFLPLTSNAWLGKRLVNTSDERRALAKAFEFFGARRLTAPTVVDQDGPDQSRRWGDG